ncbi:poly(3-hydroxybutyrate) depolymerase [Lysobacter sp. TY2-98]|uniref:extracellular catalytic domain type 1 short-chain-length polyhydroxyalkanoate depolymerase n=1 Tax=Lysobacter sp. TY2-98 TaxID=2290922 RepID=UPI000E207318|nr:PHB depolymerase family esterase [Lysobacter sp. TY2-98]AXK72480.1 poly(3-hydroxybutyrate) depolymerase [Lysobacter sp. TY2-98]
MRHWRWFVVALLFVVAIDVLAQVREGRFAQILRARAAQRHANAEMVTGGDPRAPITAPGDYRYEIQHDGITRLYRVHVPHGYRAGQPMPMLVALHGGGGDMDWQADDSKYGLITASEAHGFIAVFPNGFSRMPGGHLATWNAGRCCAAARDRNVDDVGFIRSVVDNVEHQLDVDHSRVYATGMSNGGMMAYRLACDAADVFRAIAPVAGTDNTARCAPSRPVAIAHFHARDDDHVLFNGGAGAEAFRDRSMVTDFTSVPATIDRWTRYDGCSAPPRRVLSVPGAYCELRAPCNGGAQVQLCVTETGAHSWPGGHKDRGEPASQAISANDVMWRFFESLPPRS